MKRISLTANQPGFRRIDFKEAGISIISARRQTRRKRGTYNSVGKSLSIYLIHFCLGANCTTDFKTKLNSWEFTLTFRIGGAIHTAIRSVNRPNIVVFDGEEQTLNEYKARMGEMIFGLNESLPSMLSYRDLMCHFIRLGKEGYTNYSKYYDKEPAERALLNTGYLLGLNVELIDTKIQLKGAISTLGTQKTNLSKDPVLAKVFLGETNPSELNSKVVELERQKSRLENAIANFQIAADYGEIKIEADQIANELANQRNQLAKYRIAIGNIAKSIKRQPDISKQDIITFYENAQLELGDLIVRRLEDVENFNSNLFNDRNSILQVQKAQYEERCAELENRIRALATSEDEKLRYLNSHGALEDYAKLTEMLSDIQSQLDKLDDYRQMSTKYAREIELVRQQFSTENIRTNDYLEENVQHIQWLVGLYMDTATRLYPDKAASLSIINNEKQNKQRFDIVAKIEGDNGEGIKAAKIFCYDWILLLMRANHNVQFIVHDSRIVSGTDIRQVAEMMRVADEYCRDQDCQYIITMNDNTIGNLRDELGDDFNRLIRDNEVLQLNDESDADKLLGMQVDLNY